MTKKNLLYLFPKVGALALALLVAPSLAASPATFAQWIAQFDLPEGQRGLDSNPAGDGVNNLLKFALGLDPTVPSRDGVPTGQVVDGRLAITIAKNPDALGVEYIVEWSNDLVNWSDEGLIVTDNTASSLTVADSVTVGGAETPRFLRLRVPAPEEVLGGPDAFLYVVGGRTTTVANAKNWDVELDRADVTTSYHTDPSFGPMDARSILIADVYFDDLTVTNWRRSTSYLPDVHPEDPLGILHWTYMHDATTYHNGRIYVGPATFNGTANPQEDGSRRIPTDIVVWADVDPVTGELGEFTASPRLPPPGNQRIMATAIVEVNGDHFFYVLGGSSDAGTTEAISYARLDPVTGAITEWKQTQMGLDAADNFNAAIGFAGNVLHTTGNVGAGWEIQITTPRQADQDGWLFKGDIENFMGGDLWTRSRYDIEYQLDPLNGMAGTRWEQNVVIGEADGQKYLYIIAGARTGASASSDRVDCVALNPDGTLGDIIPVDPLPAARRRSATAAYQDIVILAGGTSGSSVTTSTDTVFIGRVQPGGNIEWTVAAEPLWQYRSFNGAALVPAAQE